MTTYHSWVLKYSWSVENGCRFIFSNTPENVHLIDITLPCDTVDLVQNVISQKWTACELTQYLNQVANKYQTSV